MEDSAAAALNDTFLDVDGCSDMVNLSKSSPNDSTGTRGEAGLKEEN